MSLMIELNGKPRTLENLSAGASLEELVTELELKADRIAIERNGDIVSRNARGAVAVGDGDKIEIVHFVGGGGARSRE